MYRNDYIVKMIEQLTAGMAAIMGLRQERKQLLAITAVDDLLNRLFRLNSRMANSLSEKDLMHMFTFNGEPETEKLVMLASLIREEGAIFGELQQPEQAYARYIRSLHLLLAATGPSDDISPELLEEVDASLQSLQEYELPGETHARLFAFWEKAGRYDHAEDALYEWLEAKQEDEVTVRSGISFYERLLELPDGKLEHGGLPRDEVTDGLESLQSKPFH